MPIYIFKNPITGKVKEVIQKMNDDHVYFDEEGTQWNRIFTSPQASMDTQICKDSSPTAYARINNNSPEFKKAVDE